MLSQVRGGLHVEIVERHDQVNLAAARQVRDGVDDVGPPAQVWHVKEFIDHFARPRFILVLVIGRENDMQASFLARLQKRRALEIAG